MRDTRSLQWHEIVNLMERRTYRWLSEDCSVSIANALEILQSCTKPSICPIIVRNIVMKSGWDIHRIIVYSVWWSQCFHRTEYLLYWAMLFANSDDPHDDVIKWKHFPRYWPFVRGIHRSPVNSPHKGQWRGALMFTLICARINGWVNNREAGDLRRYRAHYDVIVMHCCTASTG